MIILLISCGGWETFTFFNICLFYLLIVRKLNKKTLWHMASSANTYQGDFRETYHQKIAILRGDNQQNNWYRLLFVILYLVPEWNIQNSKYNKSERASHWDIRFIGSSPHWDIRFINGVTLECAIRHSRKMHFKLISRIASS